MGSKLGVRDAAVGADVRAWVDVAESSVDEIPSRSLEDRHGSGVGGSSRCDSTSFDQVRLAPPSSQVDAFALGHGRIHRGVCLFSDDGNLLGGGYVLEPWETLSSLRFIPEWPRGDTPD